MREYGSISPRFWIGETGKKLRGDPEAQLLAIYLMTSPHANMIGVFHCPVLYMAHETGISMEGASKALARLIKEGFCTYDEPSETVFVLRMVVYQVGESLKAGDNRCLGIGREVDRIAVQSLKHQFLSLYAESFHLKVKVLESPSKAPPKQLTGTGQEQEQEQDKRAEAPAARATRLEIESLPPDWKAFCLAERADLDPERTFAKFSDYWKAKPGKEGRKLDWQATWRNWVRAERAANGNSGQSGKFNVHAYGRKLLAESLAAQAVGRGAAPENVTGVPGQVCEFIPGSGDD